MPYVALLIAAGGRPDMAALRALSASSGSFHISLEGADPDGDEGWAELLVNGLTFDLRGVAPAQAVALPAGRYRVGLPDSAVPSDAEAIMLSPGPHLLGGVAMVPVLRSMAALAAQLCALGNVAAVSWGPAANLCDPAFFAQQVYRWVQGGVFPGLALVSLAPSPDGGMTSVGLAQFGGQELRMEPELGEGTTELGKLALRLVDLLVRQGRIAGEELLTAPDGRPLRLTPSDNGKYLRVWRG